MHGWQRLVAFGIVGALCGCGTVRPRLEDSVVKVSEVHFDPSGEQGKAEFIEVTNRGDAAQDLSGWFVTGAGRVELPGGTKIAPGGAIVIAKDQPAIDKLAGRAVKIAAPFGGKLKGSGETIRVEDPAGRVSDEVSYDPADPEYVKARGTGSSLHRADYGSAGGATPGAWKAGPPSPGKGK